MDALSDTNNNKETGRSNLLVVLDGHVKQELVDQIADAWQELERGAQSCQGCSRMARVRKLESKIKQPDIHE
jgi:hypothetical protein